MIPKRNSEVDPLVAVILMLSLVIVVLYTIIIGG